MRRRLLRILPFLAVLLLAVVTAAVLAPSAMTKKEPPPPPPTPSGSFTLNPGAGIALTNMTLTSNDGVVAAAGAFVAGQPVPGEGSFTLGDNSSGGVVALDDWAYVNTHPYPVTVIVGLLDATADEIYLSNGTMSAPEGGFLNVTHAKLGWTEDATQILLSINDGSQNPTTNSIPELGAGNFNATIQLTAAEWPVTITNITGYSDGLTVNESNTPMCGFHAVITYTGKTSKKATVTATTVLLAADNLEGMGYALASLGASPFDPGSIYALPINMMAGFEYQFAASIENSTTSDTLGVLFSSPFTIDPSTFVDGCPPDGQQLVSTDLG